MASTIKKKLCWNCEGRVTQQEEHCPYCGVYIDGTLHSQNQVDDEDDGKEDALQSDDNQPHKPPYTPDGVKSQETMAAQVKAPMFSLPALSMGKMKSDLLPLILLLSGSVFLLFGLALLMFEENGVFYLEWDASWWYAYLLIALPALLFGWRFLNAPQETSIE